MKFRSFLAILSFLAMSASPLRAQINADQVMKIGRNALYFEDYMVAIQYFNQAINAKPYLAQPYFYRAVAKFNLDDFTGAENDASIALSHNPFLIDAWEVRGVARQNLGKFKDAVDDYSKALEMLPENRGMLYNKAVAQEAMKDYDGAKESFEILLKKHPGFDGGYIARAKMSMSTGDSVKAIADIDKAIEINPNATNAFLMRAEIAMNRGNIDEAIEALDKVITLEPRQAGLFINRSFMRYRNDDYFGAMADLDYALTLDPINTTALYNRALLRAEVHDNDKAIDDLSKVLEINSSDYRSLYNRAILYKEKGAYRQALDDINRVISDFPDFAAAYFLRFDIERESGNLSEAQRDYNKSIALAKKKVQIFPGSNLESNHTADTSEPGAEEITEESQEVVAARFSSLLTVANNPELENEYNNDNIRGRVQDRASNIEAEPLFIATYYSSPTQLKPGPEFARCIDEINHTGALPHLLLLTNHEAQLADNDIINRHFQQIDSLSRKIEAGTPRSIDFFTRAMEYFTVRDYGHAADDLTKAIDSTPEFAGAIFVRGCSRYRLAKAEESGRMALELALQDFDRVTELDPSMAIAHFNKGCVLMALRDYTSALSSFNDALKLKADFGEAYYNRGYVYMQLGNKAAGLSDLSKAGELGVAPSYSLMKRLNR